MTLSHHRIDININEKPIIVYTYCPLLANSIDLMAVVFEVPVLILNEAFTSKVVESMAKICDE